MSESSLRTPLTLADLVVCLRGALLKNAGNDKCARILLLQRMEAHEVPTATVIAELALWGNEFRHALAANPTMIAASVIDRPITTGNRITDTWVAGLAEHLARRIDAPPPEWCLEPVYFLDEPVFFGGDRFRELALLETPSAWRRRNLFCGATAFS